MQTRIDAGPVTGLALRGNGQGIIQELKRTSAGLFLIPHFKGLRQFEEGF